MHVAVAGNIGAGKTTLVKQLAKHFNWSPHFEAVEENPYLEDFYQDMKSYSFPLQIYFLHSRFNQIMEIIESGQSIIQDRTIYEDAFIFAKNLHQSGYMTQRDYENYFSLFQSMINVVQPPDLLIYLRSGLGKLMDQIAHRGREYENSISIKYLEDLNNHYEEWIGGYTNGRLLIIDVNNLDYVHRREDMAYVINKVDTELHGLFSKVSS